MTLQSSWMWAERFSDFREVQSGVWWPYLSHRISVTTNAAPTVLEAQAASVAVGADAVIPGEIVLPPGATVSDEVRHVVYTAGESEAAILARMHENNADRDALDALMGTPAPEFPNSAWLNGKALSWTDVAGKVVILDFWAQDCGPCLGDLPELNELHARSSASGIIVIGVHAAAEIEVVRKRVQELDVTYPVCIDLPAADNAGGFGILFNQFAVASIPIAFVVNQKGRVVAYGSLADCREQAERLANVDPTATPQGDDVRSNSVERPTINGK